MILDTACMNYHRVLEEVLMSSETACKSHYVIITQSLQNGISGPRTPPTKLP